MNSQPATQPNQLPIRKRRMPGIYLEPDLLDSAAFNDLNRTALRVLIHFYRKRQFPSKKDTRGRRSSEILNNGEIVFLYSEAQDKLGVSKSAFTRSLDSLIGHGFLDIANSGAGLYRSATLYLISSRWMKWNTSSFEEGRGRAVPVLRRGFAAQGKGGTRGKT